MTPPNATTTDPLPPSDGSASSVAAVAVRNPATHCPECGGEIACIGGDPLLFICREEQFQANRFQCQGKCRATARGWAVVLNPPAEIPNHPGASDLEQNTWIHTCPFCQSTANFIGPTTIFAGPGKPMLGGRCSCRKCSRTWLIADGSADAALLKAST